MITNHADAASVAKSLAFSNALSKQAADTALAAAAVEGIRQDAIEARLAALSASSGLPLETLVEIVAICRL